MLLTDAEAAAPAPSGLGAWAEKLRSAAYNAVAEKDVEEMIGVQVEKAKKGDVAAAKFVLGFLTGGPPKVQVKQIVIRSRGKQRRVEPKADPDAEPPPQRHAQPNPTPALAVYRRLTALFIHTGGPASVAAIGQQLELPRDQMKAVIDCPWFAVGRGDAIELTTIGRQAVA